MKKELSEAVAASILVKILGSLITFFNVGKSMNDAQVVDTVKLIMQEYYFLKLEDLKLCFDGMKAGKYLEGGKLFDRLDGQIILLALQNYTEERMTAAEALQLEKHKTIIAADKEEFYMVKIGEGYLRSCGDDFEEVEKKEMATLYTYGVAIRLKSWIIKEHYPTTPDKVKISDSRKAEGSFFDYLEHNAPELLPKGERFKRATSEYYAMKQKILEDKDMGGFEKANAIRALSGLEPLTVQEYNEQQVLYNNL